MASGETFALDVAKFCEKANGNADTVLRKVLIDLSAEVIQRSPVGNPELWKRNANAMAMAGIDDRKTYNLFVDAANATLAPGEKKMRKLGKVRMANGLKMQRYVGGRFRANWTLTEGAPATDTTDATDASGSATQARNAGMAAAASIGGVYWLVNNLPYAIPLEHGHSTQAPAGMVGIATARFQEFINNAVAGLAK